ncbi:MAG: glycosyltransferase family 4 protein [Xanthobacteraceae bacterium]
MRRLAFAVPGDLDTPTGGYAYDKRIIAELRAAGWQVDAIDIGAEFPQPSAEARAAAVRRLTAIAPGCPLVIDGLAFGVMAGEAPVLSARGPLVALVHHPLACETGLDPRRASALRDSERAALACAHAVIVPGEGVATIVADDYGVPRARITVVEPGVDRVMHREHAPRAGGAVELLAVGAVTPRKGYDVLVAALAELTDLRWRLTIAGDFSRDPEFSKHLAEEIERKQLGERITMAGAVSAARLSELFAAADLFVLASRFEGYGMVLSEAAVHGLPIVASDVGAASRIVGSGAGVLATPGDAAALREALRSVIASDETRRRMAEVARAHRDRLPQWQRSAEIFAGVLERLT